MDGQKKDVSKPLTTNEIRSLVNNWSLAGDAGLLAHLEQFSQDVFSKTQETQSSFNELLNSFEETSTVISNVTNQFLALQNSQFVENRVYDDETPTEEKKEDNKVVDEEAEEKVLLAQYKQAVEVGIKLLDTHFEEVQLPASSDSDDEDITSGNSALLWRPKNPYAGKRFPLLIGSAEWWADDNVGLGEYEENMDSEKVLSESESDVEADRNIEKRIRMSSTSSTESDLAANKKLKVPPLSTGVDDIFIAPENDIFDNTSNLFSKKEDDLFGEPENIFRDDSKISPSMSFVEDGNFASKNENRQTFQERDEANSLFDEKEDSKRNDENVPQIPPVAVKQKQIQNAFTKELTAKLGSVANKQSENVNGDDVDVPDHSKSRNKERSALFLDDDKNDDLFSSKTNSADVPIPRKNNLFSDSENDDELFGSSSNSLFTKSDKNDLFNSDKNSSTTVTAKPLKNQVNNASQVVPDVKSSKVSSTSKSLFDDDLFGRVDDDDTLFSTKPVTLPRKNILLPSERGENSPRVKFSTPVEVSKNSVIADDLFGEVSAVHSGDDSNTLSDNSLNAARLFESDVSKDLGFGEHTVADASNNKSIRYSTDESPTLFRPQLSSTRRTSQMSQETSDYKTQKISDTTNPHSKSDSSNVHQSQENSLQVKMGHSEKAHFSRAQSDSIKSKGLFDEEEEDDLFSSAVSNPVRSKESKLSENVTGVPDDLFSNVKTGPFDGEKKTEIAPIFKKPDASLFEEEENALFSDAAKQDAVSVSSSRSSLFDDVSVGKSTLPSIFEKDGAKNDDLFGSSDSSLFGDKKERKNDLFSTEFKSKSETDGKIKSLFGDVEDGEDLFASEKDKKFSSRDFDGLFTSKTEKKIEEEKKLVENETDEKNRLFDGSNDAAKIIVKANEINASSKPAEKLFGGLKEEDDLFSDKEKCKKTKEMPKAKTENVNNLFNNAEEENLFTDVERVVSGIEKIAIQNQSAEKTGKKSPSNKLKNKSEPLGLFNDQLNDDLFGDKSSKSDRNLFENEEDDLFKNESSTKKPKVRSDSIKEPEASENSFKKPEKGFSLMKEPVKSGTRGKEREKGENVFKEPQIADNLFGKSEKSPSLIRESAKSGTLIKEPEKRPDLFEKPETGGNSIKEPETSDSLFKEPLFNDDSPKKMSASDNVVKKPEASDNLFQEPEIFNKSTDKKPEPPKSLNLKKQIGLFNEKKEEPDGEAISSAKPRKVGKLNINPNLNINPTALLPGAKLSKDTVINKEPEIRERKPERTERRPEGTERRPERMERKPEGTERRPERTEGRPERTERKPESALEKPVEITSNLLRCTSKDRVKIQARRRPQSRRARQEALRSSGIDFGVVDVNYSNSANRSKSMDDFEAILESPTKKSQLAPLASNVSKSTTVKSAEPDESATTKESKIRNENPENSSAVFHSVENSPETLFSSPIPSNPLSPSTDEEDYFNVPELDVNFEKEDQSIFKNELVNREKVEKDDLLFDGAPVLSPLEPKKDLFSEVKNETDEIPSSETEKLDDEDDDLFRNPGSDSLFGRNPKESTGDEKNDPLFFDAKPNKFLTGNEPNKKSLFDDNADDNDDLFGDNKSIKSIKSIKPVGQITKSSKNVEIKSKNTEKPKEAFVDPLGLMSNPD